MLLLCERPGRLGRGDGRLRFLEQILQGDLDYLFGVGPAGGAAALATDGIDPDWSAIGFRQEPLYFYCDDGFAKGSSPSSPIDVGQFRCQDGETGLHQSDYWGYF